jgi:hypothetical protein
MLPVEVSTPTLLPTERAAPAAPSQSPHADQAPQLIEIRLRNGHSIAVSGHVDGEALARVIDLLVKR